MVEILVVDVFPQETGKGFPRTCRHFEVTPRPTSRRIYRHDGTYIKTIMPRTRVLQRSQLSMTDAHLRHQGTTVHRVVGQKDTYSKKEKIN
jgi:hypothetical protein